MARVEDFGWLRVEFDGDRKDRFGEWFDGEAAVDSFGVGLGGSSSKEGDDAAFVDGVGGGGEFGRNTAGPKLAAKSVTTRAGRGM